MEFAIRHNLAWCDELAKYPYAQDCWDNLRMGLSLGKRPRALVTTTPRPLALIKALVSDPKTVFLKGTSYENAGNLTPAFPNSILSKYQGTRGRHAEVVATDE